MGLVDFAGTPRFSVRRRLGAGGMGVVYEAVDRQRGTRVALKTIPRLDAASLYRFKQEFRLLADVVHENLVRLHELVCEGDQWFFSMDLVQGVDFLSYCWGRGDVANDGRGPVPRLSLERELTKDPLTRHASGFVPARAADDMTRLRAALRQLMAALDVLHGAGKVHRDVKPGNILVEPHGRLVLLDFGLGVDMENAATGPTDTERILGTPEYMAPEQAAPQGLSAAADLYAVGVVLFEALTGRLPFEGGSMEILLAKQWHAPPRPSDFTENVPKDLDELCVQLLSPHPGDRPSAAEVLRRLGAGELQTSGSLSLRPPTVPQTLVGRAPMLSRLANALDAVRQGRPALVHVVGTSGMGKTALVRHFLSDAEAATRSIVLSGRCYEHESVPYKGFDALIDGLSHRLSGMAPHEVEAFVPRDARALVRVFPVLERVRAFAMAPVRGAGDNDPQKLRARAFGALRELLARLSDRYLVVLHIDDLQWGDADSAALLGELVSSADPPAVLLIVSYRSEDVGAQAWLDALARAARTASNTRAAQNPQGALAYTIQVDKLAEDDALALSASLLDARDDDPRARSIARESAGSPFFIGELVRHVQVHGGDRMVRLERVIEARLSGLPSLAQTVLELACVSGRPLSRGLAIAMLDLPAEDVDTAFATLSAARLIRMSGTDRDRYEPYHDRIRETVLGTLGDARRKQHHESIARALEQRGDADPDELFAHFEAAGFGAEAARHAQAAAERATDLLAFDRAAELYRRALSLTDSTTRKDRLRILVADSLARAGRGAAAADAYMGAASHAEGATRLDLLRRASEQLLFSGHIDRGVGLVREVLAQVGMRLARSPFTALLGLLVMRVVLAVRGMRFQVRSEENVPPEELSRIDACAVVANGLSFVDNIQGKLFQSRAFLYALRAGEPARIVHALAGESIFRAVDGHRALPRAIDLLDRAEALMEQGKVEHHEGTLQYGRGMVYHITGHWLRAHECFARAEALFEGARAAHYRVELDGSQSYGITVEVLLGRLKQASARHAALLREAEDRGDLFLGTNLSIGVPAQCWLFADQPATARTLAAEAMARWSPAGFHLQHWHELVILTSIDLYEGEPERALERMRVRWAPFKRSLLMRIEYIRMFALHMRAACHVAAAVRDPRGARLLLSHAERDARALARNGARYAEGLAQLIRAGASTVRGDKTRAISQFESAILALDDANLSLYAHVARRRLGELREGAEGQALLVRSDGWMIAEGVRKPERVANMLAPGRFPSTRGRTYG